MRNVGLVASVVLLCSVTLVPAFSEDDNQGNNSQRDDNQERDSKFDFSGYSNRTISYADYSNKTNDDWNKTSIGQEISDFVHKRNDLEQQKRGQIIAALKQCRHDANESGNKTAMQQCITSLKLSLKQFRSFVFQQNALFKQFRQGLGLGNNTITQDQNKQSLDQFISQISHSHGHAGTNHANKHNRHH